MSLDDLKESWRRGVEAGAVEEPARDLLRVRERARRLESVVRRRDLIESACAFALLPVFGYFALRPQAPPLSRVGSAILVLACLVIPLRLRAARGRSPDPSLPVATFLRLQLDLVVRQRRLLLTVPLWYLAPLGVGVVLFVAGGSTSWVWTVAYAAIVALFFVHLARLNRAAVQTELEPRERELRLWIQLGDREADNGREEES